MADFKTHIGASTLVGIGYGATGYALGVPLPSCLIATGACGVAGMLPDLDSDSGVPVREMMCFTAAVIPALMIHRFREMGMGTEHIVLAAGLLYLAVRFGVVAIFRKYTVHRGMWHSIPAGVTAALIVFLLASGDDIGLKLFKSIAVFLGFMIHLILDELWSFEQRGATFRVKKSFGTALKFWTTKGLWPNISTYGKLIVVSVLVISDPYLMEQLGVPQRDLPRSPSQWLARFSERGHELMQRLQGGCIVPEQHELSVESPPLAPDEGQDGRQQTEWCPPEPPGSPTVVVPRNQVAPISAGDQRYGYSDNGQLTWGAAATSYRSPADPNPRYATPSTPPAAGSVAPPAGFRYETPRAFESAERPRYLPPGSAPQWR